MRGYDTEQLIIIFELGIIIGLLLRVVTSI